MEALAQATDPDTGNQQLADLRIFSVGTGLTPQFVSGDMLDWGLAQWARVLANMMIEGMMGVADYEGARLLGDKYFRLGPGLPAPGPLDCADKIASLIAYAQGVAIA